MLSAICRRQFIRTVENIRLLRCFSAEAHSSEGSSEGKSEGRWSNWTGKNAWKLGFLSLSISGFCSLGLAISSWGEFF